jgi:hypothetical protein
VTPIGDISYRGHSNEEDFFPLSFLPFSSYPSRPHTISESTEMTGKIPLQITQVGTPLGTDFLVGLVFSGGGSPFPDGFFPAPRSGALGRSTRCSGGSVPEVRPRLELRRMPSGVANLDDRGSSEEDLEGRLLNLAEVLTTASDFATSPVIME